MKKKTIDVEAEVKTVEEPNKIKSMIDKLFMKVGLVWLKLGLKAGRVYPIVKKYQMDSLAVLKNPKVVLDKKVQE